MEPKEIKNEITEDIEKPFCDRPYEEVEDGYIDDRGFYTTPNGSFWDDDKTYFNHLGFDHHGGTYDKYGVYQPGPDYDEKTGLYKDQKELFILPKIIDENENENAQKYSISKLRDQEKKDEKTMKKYEHLVEESEEEDDDDKSNITFDEEDIKEAYENVMEIENKMNHTMNIKLTKHNNNNNTNNINTINP